MLSIRLCLLYLWGTRVRFLFLRRIWVSYQGIFIYQSHFLHKTLWDMICFEVNLKYTICKHLEVKWIPKKVFQFTMDFPFRNCGVGFHYRMKNRDRFGLPVWGFRPEAHLWRRKCQTRSLSRVNFRPAWVKSKENILIWSFPSILGDTAHWSWPRSFFFSIRLFLIPFFGEQEYVYGNKSEVIPAWSVWFNLVESRGFMFEGKGWHWGRRSPRFQSPSGRHFESFFFKIFSKIWISVGCTAFIRL